jgi:hypothetical protein
MESDEKLQIWLKPGKNMERFTCFIVAGDIKLP